MFKKLIAAAVVSILSFSPVLANPVLTNLPSNDVRIITEAPNPKVAQETKKEATQEEVEIKTVPSKGRYIVRNDPGGEVSQFIESLIYAKNMGYKFKIDGYCASACTLILATPLRLDLCVTPKASMMFHQPFAMNGREIYYSIPYIMQAQSLWDNLFLKFYPEFVKKAISKNGGVPNVYKSAKPSDMFVMKYDDLKKDIPTCAD